MARLRSLASIASGHGNILRTAKRPQGERQVLLTDQL